MSDAKMRDGGVPSFRLVAALAGLTVAIWNIWSFQPDTKHWQQAFDTSTEYASVQELQSQDDEIGRASASIFTEQEPIKDTTSDPVATAPEKSSFCHPWSHNSDDWWTHHPQFEVYNETDESYCFRKIEDTEKAKFFQELYSNQYNNGCNNTITKKMWSSGWGADMKNIVGGMLYGHFARKTFVIDPMPWHYAAPVEADKANDVGKPATPACPLLNMYCYFLNITNCPASEETDDIFYYGRFQENIEPFTEFVSPEKFLSWTREYMLRPQTWLRHKVYKFLEKQPPILQPCTVIHVRRGDIVLHEEASRKYRAISEYVETKELMVLSNILLLTDDANAIGEAKTLFPQKNWMYIDRPRFRASEGGFERQLPSNDPVFEVVVLLSTLHMVGQCQSIVRTSGSMGDLFEARVQQNGGQSMNLDAALPWNDTFAEHNSETIALSRSYDDPALSSTPIMCHPWSDNSDDWWTHHPQFEVYNETDESYCFRKIEDPDKAKFFQELYSNQYNKGCNNTITKKMWSSGWGADMKNIVGGMLYGHFARKTFVVDPMPWHYAAPVEADKANDGTPAALPACPLLNMYCYFLNITDCPASDESDDVFYYGDIEDNDEPFAKFVEPEKFLSWTQEYMLRPQTWLRYEVYKFLMQQTPMRQPCTVIHVRRGDIVLHDVTSRKYRAISEYLETQEVEVHSNILLLTDDANAIGEAKSLFPEKHWMNIDRPRFHASEGGFEHQIPSNDPVFEVVVLLSTFHMVEQCQSIVRTTGNLGGLFEARVQHRGGQGVNLDTTTPDEDRFAKHNSKTIALSRSYDDSGSTLCHPWSHSSDDWWTHHPQFEVFNETHDSYCFRKIGNPDKAKFFGELHANQYANGCNNTITKKMWSSGWGADVQNVVGGLLYGHFARKTFVVDPMPWHYAAPVEADKANDDTPAALPACPLLNMYCYFLNITDCLASEDTDDEFYYHDIRDQIQPFTDFVEPEQFLAWTQEYILRPQTWLRYQVFKFLKKQPLIRQPCTVIHVRRGDIVLHEEASRKYRTISEYLDTEEVNVHRNILLLTDDANAIGEAKTLFPEKHWMHINRPRFRASEGGFERQIPSNDPIFEVVVLLSTFHMVEQCQSIVHTTGNFAGMLADRVIQAGGTATDLDTDESQLYRENNAKTVTISRTYEKYG